MAWSTTKTVAGVEWNVVRVEWSGQDGQKEKGCVYVCLSVI